MESLRGVAVKFLVFAVVASLLGLLLWNTMTNSVGGATAEYHAVFSDVSGLRQGDDVRMAGVKVGRVDSIEVVDNRLARIDFTMRADQALYRSTGMVVRYQNLLGQRYVALTDGGSRARRLAAGSTIPDSRTSGGFDLTALLNGFRPLFDVMNPKDVNTFAENLISVLQGESGTVGQLLRQTATFTNFLADRDAVFKRVLDNLTPVLTNLAAHDKDLDGTVTQLRLLMTGLAHDRGQVGSAIQGIGDLIGATADLAHDARPPLRSDVVRLRTTAKVLASNRERLGKAVDRLPVLLSALAHTQSQGAWLSVYLCNLGIDTGPATVWVGGSGGPYSEACR